MVVRRTLLGLLLAALLLAGPTTSIIPSLASEAAAWNALKSGAIVLFRHANAPGGGDPSGFKLGDCSTQRNLDIAGQQQATRIGEAFRLRDIAVGTVLVSEWCRSRETAERAFPGQARVEAAFNSFFDERGKGPDQTKAARSILLEWRGKGALVVVTHQVNITSLTGIVPASGEGVVLRGEDGILTIVGRILP